MRHNLKLKEDFDLYELADSEREVAALPSKVLTVGAPWFLLLLSLVVLDGFLTYIGISFSSTDYEANVLVKSLMDLLGVGIGIILSKSVAILSLYILWLFRRDIVWIFSAIKGLVFVYLSLAIIPWFYVLTKFIFPLV